VEVTVQFTVQGIRLVVTQDTVDILVDDQSHADGE
jgi:hypothetical protein